MGTRTEVNNATLLDFVRKQGRNAQYLTSVCTGAMVPCAAGFLAGKKATTHWAAIDELRAMGDVTVVEGERWVQDGNVLTSAGVSAGIDMALYLVGLLKDPSRAKGVQKMMEYYPKPPTFTEVPV
jgi:transcriptional regulator GlxA family with amidase domain